MAESSDSELELIPPNITYPAKINMLFQKDTTSTMIPKTSKKKYEIAYNSFIDWRKEQNTNSFSENVLMAYFEMLANKFRPSTLWAHYSMLKTTIYINDNVKISFYAKLRAFLKRASDGYRPKKSKTFSVEEINKFIDEAPDYTYLFTKVVLIMGIMGACRRDELYNMKVTDLEDLGSAVLVQIPNTKAKMSRKFTITGRFYTIYKKYADLRPRSTVQSCFFLNYQKGRCTLQRIGINKFGNAGKEIAVYLKLPNAELYTGHCFRRSATALEDDSDDPTPTAPIKQEVCSFREEKKQGEILFVDVPGPSSKGHSSSLKSSQEINDSSSAVSDDDSATEEMYTGEADLDYENPTETKISDMIEVSDTQVISNVSETAKENPDLSTNVPFPTADECDVFGEYISKHLQQLPLSIALKLQSGIHELVMQTRLEYVRQNPNKAPPMVKEEKLIEEVEPTRPTTSPQYPQDPMKKRTEKRPRATDPPDPNKRPKPNTHSDSIITNQANDPRTDVDVFAKHIKMQLEQLPDLISLQLRSDIYAMIVQAKTKTLTKNDTEVPGNSVRIKDEVIETDHEDLIDSYDLLSS